MITFYVLLEALQPVCMNYAARDESRVTNIAQGEADFKQYGSYRTVKPSDPPTQNTITWN